MTDLENRFQQFMLQLPSIEGIDGIKLSAEERKQKIADYFGLGRSIIIEQKAISKDQSDKIQGEIELHSNEDYYPYFYGKRDIDLVLNCFPNAEDIKRKIYTRITKLLEGYLTSANKQIVSTSRIFDLSYYAGVLVILNDKVKVLSPEIIASRVAQRLKEKRTDKAPRFSEIDYVLIISETHLYKGQIPSVLTIEGPEAKSCGSEVSEYLAYIVHSWAAFNGGDLTVIEDTSSFFDNLQEKSDLQPKKVTRSEERRLWYGENRYMKDWSDNKVLEAGAGLIETIRPFVTKGGPRKPEQELADMMLAFGDFIEESNYRGLDLRDMKQHFSEMR